MALVGINANFCKQELIGFHSVMLYALKKNEKIA